MDEARKLSDLGYTEIQLLGQNVNSYRDPSAAGWNFATLLARIAEIPGLRRVRFTTSHPRDFTKEIVDAIDSTEVLCNHVHLPVQSGSNDVLKRMDRLYDRDQYMRRIEWLKKSARDIAITTDVIVGFPGESDTDFQRTLDLIDEVEYDSMFSFKYSPRPNTPALQFDSQIPEEEKSRRLTVLQEKQRQIQIHRNARYVGRIEETHVEGFNTGTGQWIGRTSQNKTLNFTRAATAPDAVIGMYGPVMVTRAGPNSLAGESVM
jgi:tRNA-2-methylthio-N6-dimethylallyladenosine synthase